MASLETQNLQTFRLNKVASHYATFSIFTAKVNVSQKRNRLLEMTDRIRLDHASLAWLISLLRLLLTRAL